MKYLMFGVALALTSQVGLGAQINLEGLKLPWKNGASPNAVYDLGENRKAIYVFEAFMNFCPACNENAAQVNEMAKEYEDTNVRFLDLGLDTREFDYIRWITTHNPLYPVVQDIDKKIFNSLKGTNLIPQTFVVDCKGQLIGGTVGSWEESDKETIKNYIEKAKETNCN